MEAMLKQLLAVKKVREDRAEREMLHARNDWVVAISAHEESVKALEDYRVFIDTEEERMFQRLFKRGQVKVEDIEDVRAAVAEMRVKEVKMKEDTLVKEKERHQAKELFDKKMVAFTEASQARSKCEELHRIEKEAIQAELLRKEEDELDELATLNYHPSEVDYEHSG